MKTPHEYYASNNNNFYGAKTAGVIRRHRYKCLNNRKFLLPVLVTRQIKRAKIRRGSKQYNQKGIF